MLSRTTVIAAVAALAMTGVAVAGEKKGPVIMTDAELSSRVAGSISVNIFSLSKFVVSAGDSYAGFSAYVPLTSTSQLWNIGEYSCGECWQNPVGTVQIGLY